MVWPKVKPPLRKDDPDAMCASSQDDHMVQDDQDKAFIIILIRMDDIVVKKVHLCHDQGHKHMSGHYVCIQLSLHSCLNVLAYPQTL